MSPEFEFLYRNNFPSFVDFAYRELHPGARIMPNWHILMISEFLEFAWKTKGSEIPRKHILNLPPNSLKTHICSVSYPAWVLANDPRKWVLIISETHDEALEIRERCAELIGSRRFRSLFPYTRIARNHKRLELTYGGGIAQAGAGYSLPSRRSDLVVIDNPQSLHSLGRSSLSSFVEIERTLKDPKDGVILMATRRLGSGDLTDILSRMAGWTICPLPAISMRDASIEFPPRISYSWFKGMRLQEYKEDWPDFERDLRAIGGEAFGWQYMQGLYHPQIQGERFSHTGECGMQYYAVGRFDATEVAIEDVRKWRAAFLEKIRG
jgi:hypothetical protein